MSTQKPRQSPRDQWTVYDPERENAHHFDKRSEAENRMDTAAGLDIEAELFPPGELPDAEGESIDPDAPESEPVEAEIIDHSPDADPEPADVDPAEYDLPDRSVGEDPFEWMPGEFVDVIDGSEAINRKGFEVLGHFYDVDVHAELQVAPEENGHEYARVKAVATTPEGRECEAFGSAHVDRGDDAPLLLEMADTRARKRALSVATGVGAVAVEELRNEVEQ